MKMKTFISSWNVIIHPATLWVLFGAAYVAKYFSPNKQAWFMFGSAQWLTQ